MKFNDFVRLFYCLLIVLNFLAHSESLAEPLSWGKQSDGDMLHNDGQKISCYAPGIIRADQGTVQMTVLMDKPSSELGNDWEPLFQMTPAKEIGGNSLMTLMFPQLSYKEPGIWFVVRSDASSPVSYGKVHYSDVSFDAGQVVHFAFSWGEQLRVYINGKRVGSAAFNQPISPIPAVFHLARVSPFRTQSVKISSIQLEDQQIARDAQQSLDVDTHTTFLVQDALKTVQTFVTPWHKHSKYASVTPHWSPATQSFVLGDEVTFPLLLVNESDRDQQAEIQIKVSQSSGEMVCEQSTKLNIKAMSGFTESNIPITGMPSLPDHYQLETIITIGKAVTQYSSHITVIPTPQLSVSDGKLAQYLGYHYDLSFDAKPLKQMGVHWVRMWGVEPFLWFNAEPVKGQFQWEKADLVIQQVKANDLQLLGLLGNMPRWAAVEPSEDHKAQHPLANVPARWKPRSFDEWENYAGKVMQRYKHDVHYWEVCNEIDFHPPGKPASFSGSTDEYLQMLKRVYKQSRMVSDQTRVLLSGLSLGSVFDPAMATDLIEKGACDSIDIFNMHAYQVMHRVDELTKAVHAIKPGMPFWQTEQMWMNISNQEKRLWLTPAIYLWFMEKGFEKFFTFGFYDMYFNRATLSPTRDHYVNAIFQNQVRACDQYIGKLTFEGDAAFTVRHQLKRTDGKILTVIGSEVGANDLVLAKQNHITAVDLMGHTIPVKMDDIQVKCTVSDMAYIISDQPLVITNVRQSGVTPLMANGSFEDVTGDIDMAGLQAGKAAQWTMRRTDFDPQGSIQLDRDARTGRFAMRVQSSGAGRVYVFEDVKIPAPGDYLFTAHFKKNNPGDSAVPYMSFFNRDENIIKVHQLTDIGSDYQQCRMVIHFDKTPPSPVALILGIFKGVGQLLVDDVNIQAVESMKLLPQQSWNMPLRQTGNWKVAQNLKDADRAIMLCELGALSQLVTLDGVCFELPQVQEQCALVASSDWPGTTTQVNGMKVGQTLKRLFFTQTCMYVGNESGRQLGRYVIHYADGSITEVPIKLDQNIRDWFVPAQLPKEGAPKPAHAFTTAQGIELSVFTMQWINPKPDQKILFIDMQSQAPGVLCLLSLAGERVGL
ncbi:MAG TPA: hypothetical protein DCM28_08175 [Phycisphaerales bacterium]|nr:hypothetical protein [Phycisphaerales bacterium]